jgi:predicted secreted acid phosphatase
MSPARILDPAVLDRVVAAAARHGENGVVVFDLDSTLLDNRPRQARILREYGERHGLAALAQTRAEHWTSWDIRDAMRAAGASDAEITTHSEPAKAYWREHFFTSEYCAIDDAIPGAAAYVARLCGTGVQIAYVTGRHQQMCDGSVASFGRLELPAPGPRVHLLMKPTFDQSDDAWKEQAYQRLRRLGFVIAAFDNEPTHINGYRAHFREAICVHLATDHSGREVRLDDGIVSIRNFERWG